MNKYLKIIFLLIPAVLSFNCERDITSSSGYGSAVSLSLIKPGGGERYKGTQSIDVEWISHNLNSDLRIELINEGQSVYSVNDVPDTGHFILPVPSGIFPSKKYQLKIESMIHPEISDINRDYFEIAPLIDGQWYFLGVTETTRLEIDLILSDFVNDTFIGSGDLRLTYHNHGEPVTYEKLNTTVGGILSFPDVGFYMRYEAGKEFDFAGKMISTSELSGRIIGYIDPVYGSLNDTLTLVRQ